MMFFYSEDDPVIGFKHVDFDKTLKNPNIMIASVKMGAHVSHFESFFNPTMWFRKPTIEFLNSFRNDLK